MRVSARASGWSALIAASALISSATFLVACDKKKGKEVTKKKTILPIGKVPDFKKPKMDGENPTPRRLRLMGGKYLGEEVSVKGYITWIYDCVTTPRNPADKRGMTDKEWKKKIEDHPSLCWKPHFRMGDDKDTPKEKSITIADVPRKLRKDEKKRMSSKDLAAYPTVPNIAVGDLVTVTGLWKRRSAKGFTNSRGLLEYKEIKHDDPEKQKAHEKAVEKWTKVRDKEAAVKRKKEEKQKAKMEAEMKKSGATKAPPRH